MTTIDNVRDVFAIVPEPLALVHGGTIICANPPLEALVGFGCGQLDGAPLRVILPNDRETTACVDANGHVFPVVVRRSEVEIGDRWYTVCAVHDRRAELQARADLYAESHTDTLTGLGNRLALEARFDTLASFASAPHDVAVLTVDVDQFKAINDRYGHPVGDAVLEHVADRLRATVRPEDTVVRTGGDEFVIVGNLVPADEAASLGRRLVAVMDEPLEIAGRLVPVSVSVGIGVGTLPGVAPRELLAVSDMSLYEAKRDGRGRCGPARHASGQSATDGSIDLRTADLPAG